MMDWHPIQGVPHRVPKDRLQASCTLVQIVRGIANECVIHVRKQKRSFQTCTCTAYSRPCQRLYCWLNAAAASLSHLCPATKAAPSGEVIVTLLWRKYLNPVQKLAKFVISCFFLKQVTEGGLKRH